VRAWEGKASLWGLRLRGTRLTLALTDRPVLPSTRHHRVGVPDIKDFGAQYPARTFPGSTDFDELSRIELTEVCQRFAGILTDTNA